MNKKEIDAIFEKATHQADALIDLYRAAYPQYDAIKKIDGWPTCGKEMWHYVWHKFNEFDKKNHPDVMPTGLWFNKGFSCDQENKLGPWEIDPSTADVTYEMSLMLRAA
uniref:Uncharacterized protein n=1 Tax=viral metagenome TaxID=1070528 RepID=A0A6H1ZAB5_9ZZZZ